MSRRDRDAFFSIFRGLCDGRRSRQGGFPFHRFAGLPPGRIEESVEEFLAPAGIEPGSRESWGFLVDLLGEAGAPPDEVARAAREWKRAFPGDPDAHMVYISALSESGSFERAQRAMFEALGGPAGRMIQKRMRALLRDGPAALEKGAFASSRSVPTRVRPLPTRPRRPLPRREPPAAPPKTSAPVPAPPSRGVHPARPQPAPPQAPKISPPPLLPAAVSFAAEEETGLLEKLLRGPHDDLDALALARRAAEVLAEDSYDRLLSLPAVRGIEHMGYQVETVLRVLKRFRGRVLLSDEVGLGKTIEAGLVLKEYMIRGQVRRALILVPPALVGQWKEELEEKFGISARTTQDTAFRKDPEGFWKGGPVLLASIALARSEAHRARLLGERFDLVIVDEAHHLKNRTTRAWEVANGLRSRFFLMLTATPVETNLSELYNLVTLLRPGTLGTEREFRRLFVRMDDPTQPKDPEKLRELLRDVMIRNTRARCGVLLAPRTARTLIVAPSPAEEALYRLVLEETRRLGIEHRTLFRLLLEEAGSSPRAVAETASRARAEASGDVAPVLGRIEEAARAVEGTAKLERLAALVPGGKVIVFSRFRATMDQIAEDLARRGILFAPFHGDMTALEKDRAVAAFAGDGDLPPHSPRGDGDFPPHSPRGDGEGAGGGEPCGYGSEALGRIARLALGGGRAAAFRVDLPECPAQEPGCFHGLNVSLRVSGARSRWGWTLVGLARYRASADDQREGLCRAAVGAPDGVPVPVPDLETLPLSPVAPGEVAADPLRSAAPGLLAVLRARCAEDLGDFRETVAKRRRRDEERLRRYFDDVAADLRRRLERRGGEALQAKLESLPADLERRLSQLERDSTVRVRMEVVGLAAVLGPGIAADLEVRRRKNTRVLEVRYDGISRRWPGLRCDGCGAATTVFAMCDEAAHVLCSRCWDACGSGGHRPCFRCEGKPGRGPGAPSIVAAAPPSPAPAAAIRDAGPAPPPAAPASAPREPATPPPAAPAPDPRPPKEKSPRASGQGASPPPIEIPLEGSDLARFVLQLLRDSSPEPLSNEAIRDETGLDPEGVRKVLAPLIKSGLVGRVGERRGTRYFFAGGSGEPV